MDRNEAPSQPTRLGTLPQNPGNCLVVSTKKPCFECIGETNNMAHRVERHDSLRGPRLTAQPDLVPFAMHACVVGFNDKTKPLRFEPECWKLNNQQRKNMPLTNDGCVDVGINVVAEKNLKGHLQGVPPLRMVQRGAIVTAPSDDSHDQQHTQLFLRAQ
jgi:predicted GIY-YIG superfamily endonuclease